MMVNQARGVQYTLPGVMHYLQTEFTKNERDRISWELERSEMRLRIAQLEAENRELRANLLRVEKSGSTPATSPENSAGGAAAAYGSASVTTSQIVNSKRALQENVKEIVELLKSPPVTQQIDPLHDLVHGISAVSLKPSTGSSSISESPNSHSAASFALGSDSSANISEDSDIGTVLAEARPELRAKTSKPRCLLKARGQQLISYRSDLLQLEYFSLQDSTSKRTMTDIPLLLDMFHINDHCFFTIDNSHIKLWSTSQLTTLDTESLNNVIQSSTDTSLPYRFMDFKNKWLIVVTTGNAILIKEVEVNEKLDKDPKISLVDRYVLEGDLYTKISAITLGMTENSFIVLTNQDWQLIILNFNGQTIQRIDLRDDVMFAIETYGSKVEEFADNDECITRLILNEKSAKVLVQIHDIVIVYSFETKKVVFMANLHHVLSDVIFNSSDDLMILAFYNGTIEARSLDDFNNPIWFFKTTSQASLTQAIDLLERGSERLLALISEGNDLRLEEIKSSTL